MEVSRLTVASPERLRTALEAARFPETPTHPVTATSTMRILAVEPPGEKKQSTYIAWNTGARIHGYDQAFAVLDAVVRQLSEDTVQRVPSADTVLVTNLARA